MLPCCACPEVRDTDKERKKIIMFSVFETTALNPVGNWFLVGWLICLRGFFCFVLDIFGGVAGIQDTNFASKDICWEDIGRRLI